MERHAKLVAEAPAKKKTRPLKPKLIVSQKASSVPFSTTLQGSMEILTGARHTDT